MTPTVLRTPILRFAALLSSVSGFCAVMATMMAFGLVGARTTFSDRWVLAFTLYLSILSIVQASTILVSQRQAEEASHRRDEALHAKLDSLVLAVPDADDALVGIENIEAQD